MSVNKTSSQENIGPNLTDVTEAGRKIVKYALIGIVSYMILSMVVNSFSNYWKVTHPPTPLPPTVGFGKLPALDFSQTIEPTFPSVMEIKLDKEELAVWQQLDRMKVFYMPQPALSLLADDKVRQIARQYGFTDQPEILNSSLYRWYKYQPLEFAFEINLDNYNFSLHSDYKSRPELITNTRPPGETEAVATVKNYLAKAGLLPADVATSSGKTRYLKSLAGQLVDAISLSDATLIEVNLNRAAIDGIYDFYNPVQNQAVIHAVLTNAIIGKNGIVHLDYDYHAVDYDRVETYPLKPVAQAIKELEAHQAYLVSTTAIDETVVREVTLGYYDQPDEQEYLQPIWIFKGDNEFQAYVSAIDSNFITTE